MLIPIENVLSKDEVRLFRERLDAADWQDGLATAGNAPGEKEVVAAIVAAADFSADAVFAACRAGLEANSVPGFLQLVDEIPKTASEKPQERFLAEAFDPGAGNVFSAGG